MDKSKASSAGQNADSGFIFAVPAIGLILMLLPEEMRGQLYLHLELIKRGEYWRFVTGHFIYVSWLHWALNTAGVFLFWWFFRDARLLKSCLPAIFFILVIVSTGLTLLSEQLIWYAGFSGILIGLFAYGAVKSIFNAPAFSLGVLVLITLYVLVQLNTGELVDGGLESVQTSSYAHAFGLIAGFIYGLAAMLLTKLKNK